MPARKKRLTRAEARAAGFVIAPPGMVGVVSKQLPGKQVISADELEDEGHGTSE